MYMMERPFVRSTGETVSQWKIFIKDKIRDIPFLSQVSKDQAAYVSALIREHHSGFVKNYPGHIKDALYDTYVWYTH